MYELRGRDGFVGCCSSRDNRLFIYKNNKIVKEYIGDHVYVYDDISEIKKFFPDVHEVINKPHITGRDRFSIDFVDTDYHIALIGLHYDLDLLIKFLDGFYEYNMKIFDLHCDYDCEISKLKTALSNLIEGVRYINHDDSWKDYDGPTSLGDDINGLIDEAHGSTGYLKEYTEKLVDKNYKTIDSISNQYELLSTSISDSISAIKEERLSSLQF